MTDRCAQHAIDVSVIVAAWKAAAFIERAISSALASTGLVVEVIAVDDASPDATFDTLTRLAVQDARIVAKRLSTNGGPSAARNLAINVARGRFVAVLDADDAMQPDRLAALVAIADSAGADIVVDNMTEVDETGRPLGSGLFLKSPEFAQARDIDLTTWVRFNNPMAGDDTLGYLKPLIRRQKLLETRVAYDTSLRNSEDYYLVAHLLAAGMRMTYTPSAGYFYTRAAGSTSHRLKPAQTRAWLDAEKRFAVRFAPAFSRQEAAALARRMRVLRNVNQLVAITDAMKARKLGASARLFVSDLRGSAYTMGMFARVAMGRALGRKAF
ncbi:MAG: glycosyltransferase family 2 protein [Hyphomonadaceae bacterium]